jgi:uncharacterized membrane-anchored protein
MEFSVSRQRARRAAYWRGSAVTFLVCILWMLVSAYAEHITQ